MHGITDNIEVRVLGSLIAAGSSIDSDSAVIDMAGYESVVFVAPITASADGGIATLTAEGSDVDGGSGMAAISGAVATATDSGGSALKDMALVVEVRKPAERFLRVNRASATANITYGSLLAVLTPHRRPVAQDASVAARAYVSG